MLVSDLGNKLEKNLTQHVRNDQSMEKSFLHSYYSLEEEYYFRAFDHKTLANVSQICPVPCQLFHLFMGERLSPIECYNTLRLWTKEEGNRLSDVGPLWEWAKVTATLNENNQRPITYVGILEEEYPLLNQENETVKGRISRDLPGIERRERRLAEKRRENRNAQANAIAKRNADQMVNGIVASRTEGRSAKRMRANSDGNDPDDGTAASNERRAHEESREVVAVARANGDDEGTGNETRLRLIHLKFIVGGTAGVVKTMLSFLDLFSVEKLKLVDKKWKECSTLAIEEMFPSKKKIRSNPEFCELSTKYSNGRYGVTLIGDGTLRYNRQDVLEIAQTYGFPMESWEFEDGFDDFSHFLHCGHISAASSNGERPDHLNDGISRFNEPLPKQAVKPKLMISAFQGAEKLNTRLPFDMSNVVDMENLLVDARSFNQNLDAWRGQLGNVKNMKRLLFGAEAFDQSLASWDVPENVLYGHIISGTRAAVSNRGLPKGWDRTRAVDGPCEDEDDDESDF
ncbi:MAG: hypothetical protein SGILL_009432 [Bacillariaceae sp.]